MRGDQRGITGLETAIIMLAFVTVASVFAYTVLSAGIFSSEKGKEAIHSALQQTRGTMKLASAVIAKDTGGPTNSTASDDLLDEIVFTVASALGGELIDLTATVDSDNDGDLSDETGAAHTMVVSYIDANQRVDDVAWTKAAAGKNDGDDLVEPGEQMRITVNVSQLATKLTAGIEFTLELKPGRGAALPIERVIPVSVDGVMNLN